jgi:hypothetical protein
MTVDEYCRLVDEGAPIDNPRLLHLRERMTAKDRANPLTASRRRPSRPTEKRTSSGHDGGAAKSARSVSLCDMIVPPWAFARPGFISFCQETRAFPAVPDWRSSIRSRWHGPSPRPSVPVFHVPPPLRGEHWNGRRGRNIRLGGNRSALQR